MAEVLEVQDRPEHGTRHARRLRRAGSIPAVLYGHGKSVEAIAVPEDSMANLLRRGTRLVDLAGAVKETAFIRDVQWDTFGTKVIHIDFTRVSADERVEMVISIELRGEAPGVRQGGQIEQQLHQVSVECPVISIPEKLTLRVNDLELGGSLTLEALELPEGVTLNQPATQTVVQCVEPQEEEEEAGLGEPAEPEVIGRKEGEEEES